MAIEDEHLQMDHAYHAVESPAGRRRRMELERERKTKATRRQIRLAAGGSYVRVSGNEDEGFVVTADPDEDSLSFSLPFLGFALDAVVGGAYDVAGGATQVGAVALAPAGIAQLDLLVQNDKRSMEFLCDADENTITLTNIEQGGSVTIETSLAVLMGLDVKLQTLKGSDGDYLALCAKLPRST